MDRASNRGEAANIVAIIPARGGSKGVPRKNIKLLACYPLVAYSIVACELSEMVERTIVSTDSEEIAEISRKYGAEVPFLRPSEISQDTSTDIEFIVHALDWFKACEGYEPEYLVHVRPTTPLRDPALMDEAIRKIVSRPESTGLRSVHEIQESPYKMFAVEGDRLVGLFPNDPRPEYYNLPRQAFPPVYQPNGYIDIIKRDTVRRLNSLYGARMLAFITPDAGELDRQEDFSFIEFGLSQGGNRVFEYLKKKF